MVPWNHKTDGREEGPMKKRLSRLLALALCACLALGVTAHAADTEPAATRGQFIQQLYDAYQARNGYPGSTDPVAWAAALGVVQGYADGSVRADAAITRTQMAVMLYRYAGMTSLKTLIPNVLPSGVLDGYTDASSVPAWAETQVKWAVSTGLWLSGSATRLGPGDTVSRAECETAIMAVYAGGARLETDWDSCNLASDASLTVDSASAGRVAFSIRNSGTDWLNCEENSGLYRKVNGGWYLLDFYTAAQTSGSTVGPGVSLTREQTYWNNGQAVSLPAGEYRIAQKTERGATPHSVGLYRTECRLSADFTLS